MIEKLDRLQGRDIYENTTLAKLNEVIDAVNKLDALFDLTNTAIQTLKKTEVDSTKYGVGGRRYIYERQSKWIGKLCRFRDDKNDEWSYSVLYSIDTDSHCPFTDAEDCEWVMCEPVSPDDDIIYKGGDNE